MIMMKMSTPRQKSTVEMILRVRAVLPCFRAPSMSPTTFLSRACREEFKLDQNYLQYRLILYFIYSFIRHLSHEKINHAAHIGQVVSCHLISLYTLTHVTKNDINGNSCGQIANVCCCLHS